ncbi:hypothetical protein KCP70_07510 [Salmonella enterica subsp. enterica]|nr:hypothetical protein KCP70_07510 [Salmonella enterica subsp. enterica]
MRQTRAHWKLSRRRYARGCSRRDCIPAVRIESVVYLLASAVNAHLLGSDIRVSQKAGGS